MATLIATAATTKTTKLTLGIPSQHWLYFCESFNTNCLLKSSSSIMVLGLGFRAVFLDWKMATSLPSDENESANCQRHHGALTPLLFPLNSLSNFSRKIKTIGILATQVFGNPSKSNSHTISPSYEILIDWIIKGWHSAHFGVLLLFLSVPSNARANLWKPTQMKLFQKQRNR